MKAIKFDIPEYVYENLNKFIEKFGLSKYITAKDCLADAERYRYLLQAISKKEGNLKAVFFNEAVSKYLIGNAIEVVYGSFEKLKGESVGRFTIRIEGNKIIFLYESNQEN